MVNNIKYIISFVDKNTNKHLCYLSDGFYTKNIKNCYFFIDPQMADAYADYALNKCLLKYLRKYNNKLYTISKKEYDIFFNSVPKKDIIYKIEKYNIIKEERKCKLKEIFE
jgi:hypothetical protein